MPSIKIRIPSFLWLLFMVLIVAPSFMVASSLEEAKSFSQAVNWTYWLLYKELYFPDFMADIFKYPVALFGMMLPTSASLIMLPFELFLQGSGPILAYAFFAGVSRPISFTNENQEGEQA